MGNKSFDSWRPLDLAPIPSRTQEPAAGDSDRITLPFQMHADLVQGPIQGARGASGAIGVVVIGRNEGERLRRCLDSVRRLSDRVVYVDSGSTDGSVAMGRALAVEVVELDLLRPFTAARARNEGFRKLLELQAAVDYVFFVDGDCEVVAGWLEKAGRFLDARPDVAVVWGYRQERHPEKSVYNMLCNIEWGDYPVGETKICGGDALVRVQAFQQVEGYRSELICGEEPEMCVRMRLAKWRIWRLGEEMTLHDAAIYRFSQWWKRMLRGGYGFAQGAALHGAAPIRHGVLESRRAWIWGFCIPLAAILATVTLGWWGLVTLILYPLQVVRLAVQGKRSARENWWRAGALVLSKFPELLGQLRYLADRYRRAQSRLIEYK
jgi:GT2 family glycosyltransferase